MKLRRITINVSRTIQVTQYEPLVLSMQEVYEAPKAMSSKKLAEFQRARTRELGDFLYKAINEEADRYRD